MSPLTTTQKRELDSIVSSTVQDIISGTSPSQLRNLVLHNNASAFASSLGTAVDAAREEPQSQSQEDLRLPRKNAVHKKSLSSLHSLSQISVRPPNRPAPIPSELAGEPALAIERTHLPSKGTSAEIHHGENRRSLERLVDAVPKKLTEPLRPLSIPSIDTPLFSEPAAVLGKSTSPLDATPKASLVPKQPPSRPAPPIPLLGSTASLNSPTSARKSQGRSDAALSFPAPPSAHPVAPLVTVKKSPSQSNLDTHLPTIGPKAPDSHPGPTTPRRHRRPVAADMVESATAVTPLPTPLSPALSSLLVSPPAVRAPATPAPEQKQQNIIEWIRTSDKLPMLHELSKGDIQLIKVYFKSLHVVVHANTAKPEELADYKRLKKVIKQDPRKERLTRKISDTNSPLLASTEQERLRQDVRSLGQSLSHPPTLSLPPAAPDAATYSQLRARKKQLQLVLHSYQKQFEQEHGRPIKNAQDIAPLRKEYAEYKALKRELLEKDRE
ncbi:hypothetical protein HDU91_005429 [Kappamyces sp. JEL0680]|nr:hypothetical protein HDU91_005429 [Kappamyces sp. JEL0680]